MAYCRRVPAFPLSEGAALLNETAERLGSENPLSPETVDSLFCTMSTIRRHIHNNPEPGFEEVKTQAFIKKILNELAGIDLSAMRACAKTGLVVDIKGTGPPTKGGKADTVKTIALRADMDALRMTEVNTSLPYRSSNEGVAHLCGHDGHMATLIGAATLVAKRAARMPSDCTVRLLFQPAEEGPGGALPMIEENCLDGVDECYGYHNWPAFSYGTLLVKPGAMMAHPTVFKIAITGKGGHGSAPQFTVDPVLTAAHVIVALQSIVSRSVSPLDQAVCSVTMVHGGEVQNVIPNTVTLQGTLRDFSDDVYQLLTERVRSIVTGVCDAFGATATVEFNPMYPCIINPEKPAAIIAALGRRLFGSDDAVSSAGLPIMGAEDFSYFIQKVPGAFFFLGSKEPKLNGWARLGSAGARSNCMCHNTEFDFNDNLAPLGAVFWIRLVEERLGIALYTEDELPFPLLNDGELPGAGGEAAAAGGKKKAAGAGPIQLPAAKKAKA